MSGLSQRPRYESDGYLIVRSMLADEAVAAPNAETARVADPSVLAVHFPHKLSATFRGALHHPAMVALLTQLIGPDVKAIQSMLFVKRPGKPGQAWRQDEHVLPTRDRSLCGVWIALDDATIENGCLWVHPGSRANGIFYPTHAHDDPRFDASDEAHGYFEDREGGIAVELARGDAVYFHGYLLHRSLPNRSPDRSRRALVIHAMSARSLLPWNHAGVSPTEDFRDIVMIAGTDPCAWKGSSDLSRPFVRLEGAL